MAEQLKIVGLVGSLRADSHTRKAVKIALEGAATLGAETELIDLKTYNLVFCDGGSDYPADVHRLRAAVSSAQGIILGTPEYHAGFSGVLKNAIDLMGFAQFGGKMVGLVGVSGGKMGAVNALNGLRTVGRNLHAWVIPEQVSIGDADDAFNDDGRLKNQALEERLHDLGRKVTQFAYLHTSKGARDFLEAWQAAPANPGGEQTAT